MKRIYYATVSPVNNREYQMNEINEEIEAREYDGDVLGYINDNDVIGLWYRCFDSESDPGNIYEHFDSYTGIENVVVIYDNADREVPVEFWFSADAPDIWYAVMKDNLDDDWGTGSRDLAEAKAMARKYPEGYIAVIEEGPDPVCVDEIHDLEG